MYLEKMEILRTVHTKVYPMAAVHLVLSASLFCFLCVVFFHFFLSYSSLSSLFLLCPTSDVDSKKLGVEILVVSLYKTIRCSRTQRGKDKGKEREGKEREGG